MKTKIYIDGFNLYFGCLKNTPHKWLDLFTLFNRHLLPRSQYPNAQLGEASIKFFTAPINIEVSDNPNSVKNQENYHAALEKINEVEVRIIKGNFQISKVVARKVEKGKALKECGNIEVWKMEEKRSDVNLAVEALYDVVVDATIEQVIIVTSDSDITTSLQKIKQLSKDTSREEVVIGLVNPTSNPEKYPTASLSEIADWTITNITEEELYRSQLPITVKGGRKPSRKCEDWWDKTSIAFNIIELLKQTEGGYVGAIKWLDKVYPEYPKELPKLMDRPINLLGTDQESDVLLHVEAYVAFRNKSHVNKL